MAEQEAVAKLLQSPETYGLDPGREVTRIDTHASMVFLAGDHAYKVKRAVSYPYMDFGTLDKRRAACAAEIRLNRRTAPELYLGIRPILRRGDGALSLGELLTEGPGQHEAQSDAVEWAVVLKRFPDDALLSQVVARGELNDTILDSLAAEIAAFHEAAEPVCGGGAAALEAVVEENHGEFAEQPEVFASEETERLTRESRSHLRNVSSMLDARAEEGLVRRCHGDLHLRNVVMLDGRPRLFDAIEFNDAIACIDVLYDLAFLLMDLDMRGPDVSGAGGAANRIMNSYLGQRDDVGGLPALPLFLSLRAAIRAKVSASALAAQEDDAARERLRHDIGSYFAAARKYLEPSLPRLVAVGGISGTGKTTIARLLAPGVGRAPGALIVRSDVERKRLFGVAETERLPESAYQGGANAHVYDRMLSRSRQALDAGQSVVLEATFLRREDRAAARKLAEAAGVPFQGVWLTGSPDTLKARVAARQGDASDATVAVVESQLERAPKGEIGWPAVSAEGEPDAVAERARALLQGEGGADSRSQSH